MIDIRKLLEDAKAQAIRESLRCIETPQEDEAEGGFRVGGCEDCGYTENSCQCFKPEDTGFAVRVYRAGLPS